MSAIFIFSAQLARRAPISCLLLVSFALHRWAWVHYLIFGSLKHLQKYAGADASGYFGFSTIGINKMTTQASSVFKSSAISSRSSVVS